MVEDDLDISSLVVNYLIKEGYVITSFPDGETAMLHIFDDVDLWILDVELPGVVSGYDLLKEIHYHNPYTPVIFTSGRNLDIDRVLGFELGADDYLSKPYSLRELMMRIKSILYRYRD